MRNFARKRFSDFTIHYKKRRRRRAVTTVASAADVNNSVITDVDDTDNVNVNTEAIVTNLTEFKNNSKNARQFMDDNLNWHDEKVLSMTKVNDFFRRNKMSLSIDTYETCDQTAKNTCNSVFKLAVEHFFWPSKSRSAAAISMNVLILDSGRFKTSKALEKAADGGGPGIHRMAIYIPNPFLFPTRPIVHAKRSSRPNGPGGPNVTSTKRVITNCSMGMFLHKLTNLHSEDLAAYGSLKFKGIWLDYCCSLLGNSWSKPKDDIIVLFKNGLFDIGATSSNSSTATTTYAVLATTLCSRNARECDSWISEKISNKLSAMQFIQETAAQHGYIALCKHEYVYKTMFFQLYYIYRQTLVGAGARASDAMDVSSD